MQLEKELTLAISGASGSAYALRLLQCLVEANCRVNLLISSAAQVVMRTETAMALPETTIDQQACFTHYTNARPDQIRVFGREDWFSPIASGSSAEIPMVICPASGGTIASIAHGMSNNLIERAADVALKERRKLILVPRETPLSEVHLENMLKLSRMGAIVLPASPGFYHQPQSIADLVDFIVARILDQLGLQQHLLKKWGDSGGEN